MGNRGVAYASKGELDRAIADYTEVICLDPRNAETYFHWAWLTTRRANSTKPARLHYGHSPRTDAGQGV